MTDLPPDLLHRTPAEAARRVALALLDEAHAASIRLDDPSDAEALHDFRVAIRRLRSTLRAWRSDLEGSAKKRHRRALKDLQNATGGGRDAEVALAWLETQRRELRGGNLRALRWMAERLAGRLEASMAHVNEKVKADFDEIEARLRDAVRLLRTEVRLDAPGPASTWADALAAKVREHVDELVLHLSRITSVEDRDESHQARITGKRLRYLVEPVKPWMPEADDLVRAMKSFQDVLGDLNDAHVLREALGAALEEAAVEHVRRLHELAGRVDAKAMRQAMRNSLRPGLLELTRRTEARARNLFGKLEASWLADGGAAVVEAGEVLARRLERAVRPPVEIERKYLLRGRPDLPEGVPVAEIDQGWLPGKELRERLRRQATPSGVQYFRTVKLGLGVERTEIEEETTPEVFEVLWRLTEGCRVRKRRYFVPDGERTWEIDEFLDRDLWLAEVELEARDEEVAPPAWLADHVKKDVTDEVKYTNLRLAR